MIRYVITLFFISLITLSYSQCAGTQSFTLTPPPVNNTYNPGQVVTLCYTLNSYTQVDLNYFEGFDLNLGPGWSSVAPLTAPINCGGGGGQWIWMTSVTSTAIPITTVGPGYFFDLNINGNAGNDFGDNNTNNCSWTFCVTLTVANVCTPQSLLLQVTVGSDGVWGSYTSTSCDALSPNTVFNGTINVTPIVLGPINHN
jgi:hypothetical protein